MIGVNIARIRKKWGMSQAAFGALIGESRNAVANYENQRSTPSLNTVVLLESLVGRDIHSAELLLSDIPVAPNEPQSADYNGIEARLERIERLLQRLVDCQPLPKYDNENDV